MFLENLEKLMKEKKWNRRTLANVSGVPYTTIDGFFKKGCENTKLSTLIKIASALGVSLDRLVSGEDFSVSEHEKELIIAYRENSGMQGAVDRLLGIRDGGKVILYRAAHSEDRHPDEIEEMPEEDFDRIKNAPATDDKLI